MEWVIADERKAGGWFISVMSSVKKLQMNYESQTDGISPSIKLWNLAVKNKIPKLNKKKKCMDCYNNEIIV
jgi:hypothetical protein